MKTLELEYCDKKFVMTKEEERNILINLLEMSESEADFYLAISSGDIHGDVIALDEEKPQLPLAAEVITTKV